jgi:hypothetical protein
MQGAYLKIIFLIIIFSNGTFAKDFDDLFNTTIMIKDESIDELIDKSFESLVFRLLGTKDDEKMKLIKDQYDSKDFLKTYTLLTKNNIKFLKASFDEETVIKQFVDNEISFIGRNRPIVFLDIEVDNGFDKPFKVEAIPYENSFESSIQEIFNEISQERGLFFEFPQNNITLINSDYFFEESTNNDFNQYKFDYFASINILRLGINSWSMKYGNEVLFFEDEDQMFEEIKEIFNEESFIYLSNFVLDRLEEEIIIKFSKVTSVEMIDKLLEILDQMISIKRYSITSFKNDEISFILEIFGTQDQFIESVKSHKDLTLDKSSKDLIEASLIKI